jgi:hypothetical protein
MPRTSTLTDVPADKVDDVVQDFKDAGATNVEKTKQPDGRYTVVATFPDAEKSADKKPTADKESKAKTPSDKPRKQRGGH